MEATSDDDPLRAVRDYYEQSASQEARRLDAADDGQVEWELRARALVEFLPLAPARVLDLGMAAHLLFIGERRR